MNSKNDEKEKTNSQLEKMCIEYAIATEQLKAHLSRVLVTLISTEPSLMMDQQVIARTIRFLEHVKEEALQESQKLSSKEEAKTEN